MQPGDLVEFFEDKNILVAVVLDLKGDRLQVLTPGNRELTLSRKRILHSCPSGRKPGLSRQEWLNLLKDTTRQREALKETIRLEEIWELLTEEGKALTAAEMADLWFGSATPDQLAAMGRALYEDRFLFKHKEGRWLPHPPEVVEHLKEKARREEELRQEIAAAAQYLRDAWEGREIADPAWRARLVQLLRDAAIKGEEAPEYPRLKAYLDQARIPGDQAPFQLLVRLQVFHEDENLDLYRLEVPQDFSPQALQEARRLSQDGAPDPYAAIRQDLTHLECFTIDGERTRDLDDALSLEEVPEGWRLGVHIADVSALVSPGDPLDLEAQERGTSIYLPESRLPMFPEEISEDTLSLVAQQPRRALSFLVTLDYEGEIQDWDIRPSFIRVRRRLSYTEADRLLKEDALLYNLSRLSERLKQRRLAQGGYELKFPEVWVSFNSQGKVVVTVEDQETPSHLMVSEAMVLANWLAARFLAERGVPAIYRAQPEPREPISREEPKPLWQLWQDRRRLSRVVMELRPEPHWGLGLAQYTFATSPIRRYLDLVTHRQILSVLLGGPPCYREEDLEKIVAIIEPAMRRGALLKTARLRYWLLKYLADKVGQKLEALVVEAQPQRYRLLLPDIFLDLSLTTPPSVSLQPGDTVRIRLDKVSPREDLVKVSLA